MLHRRYADGLVLFDPVDGLTYTLSGDALDIVDLISAFIAEGTTDPEQLLDRAIREYDADADRSSLGQAGLDNLKRWIQLALRMQH